MNNEMPLLRRWGLAFLTASVPLLVMLIILIGQGYQWGNHAPAMGDEINYWHQAATWARAGTNGGYYVIDDTTARLPISHFFAWGFGPPVFYGVVAQLFGWPLNGVLNVNAVFFFLSVAAFVLLARLDARRCGLLALLLTVYPAILVYLPTSMLEPVYLACALVLAGGLYRLHQGERDWWVILLTGAVLVLMSIMRFTYGLMFWPYLYYLAPWRVWTMRARPVSMPVAADVAVETAEGKRRLQGRDIAAPMAGEQRWLYSFIGTVILTAIFFFTYNITTSPYPYALTLILGMIRTEPVNAFLYYINMVTESVLYFLVPTHLPSIVLRWVALSLVIWSIRQRGRARTRLQREGVTLILYIMGGAFTLGFFAYTTVLSVGFRFLAPYVLMSLALMIAWDGERNTAADPLVKPKQSAGITALMAPLLRLGFLRLAILAFALTVPLVFIGLDTFKDRAYQPGRAERVEQYRQTWASVGIVYTPDANPWCNTLAHSITYLGGLVDQDQLLALDAGMGISIIWWKPDQPQRARFLMLDDEEYYPRYPDKTNLTKLMEMPGGAVYRNEAVVCP